MDSATKFLRLGNLNRVSSLTVPSGRWSWCGVLSQNQMGWVAYKQQVSFAHWGARRSRTTAPRSSSAGHPLPSASGAPTQEASLVTLRGAPIPAREHPDLVTSSNPDHLPETPWDPLASWGGRGAGTLRQESAPCSVPSRSGSWGPGPAFPACSCVTPISGSLFTPCPPCVPVSCPIKGTCH